MTESPEGSKQTQLPPTSITEPPQRSIVKSSFLAALLSGATVMGLIFLVLNFSSSHVGSLRSMSDPIVFLCASSYTWLFFWPGTALLCRIYRGEQWPRRLEIPAIAAGSLLATVGVFVVVGSLLGLS